MKRKPRHKKHSARKPAKRAARRSGRRLGKFDSNLDAVVQSISLDGSSDTIGDVQGFGHYSAVRLGRGAVSYASKTAREVGEALSKHDLREVRDNYGAIVHENEQGFVDVSYYSTKREYDRAWKDLESEYEGHDSEYGDDD